MFFLEVFVGLGEIIADAIPDEMINNKKGRKALGYTLVLLYTALLTGWLFLTLGIIRMKSDAGTGVWLLWALLTVPVGIGMAWFIIRKKEIRERKKREKEEAALRQAREEAEDAC